MKEVFPLKHRTRCFGAAVLAALVLAMLCVPALAAEIAVDYTSEYQFSAADFSDSSELEGVYISAVPPAYQAELCIGSRVLRRGDILPVAALEKLKLNDASMSYEPESSIALGFGFRCGFLGLLHMEIILERLEREYNLDLITTAPNVVYKITKTDGTQLDVYTPLNYPDPAEIAEAQEPYAKANLIAPPEYVGAIMDLCQNRRGEFVANMVKESGAQGLVLFMQQFCDPEEMEFPYLKKALDAAGIPFIKLGIDQQMRDFGQAATAIQAFADVLSVQ